MTFRIFTVIVFFTPNYKRNLITGHYMQCEVEEKFPFLRPFIIFAVTLTLDINQDLGASLGDQMSHCLSFDRFSPSREMTR